MKKKTAPKKRMRNLEKSRAEILKVAFFEIFTKGFQGVSVDDIVKKTSLTKGAFYHQFPTKLDLGYALVDEVITPMILERWITPLEGLENPLQGILKQLKKNIGEADSTELAWGCPLNNLVQEMAPIDEGFRQRLEKGLRLWIDETDRHLTRAQKDGYIKADVRTRDVAHFVVMSHEGFYGMLKGLHDPKAFTVLYDSLKRYFQTIENNSTRRTL